MTEALLTAPEVADQFCVSLACLVRWHLERRGGRFIKLGPSYGYLVVPPTMGNGAVGLQRVPVPIVMWNPVKTHRSVSLRLFGPTILEVAGEEASILVCYGQLLSWPILQSAVLRPTLIVGLADDNWAHGTPIPTAQQAAVTAWAQLFRLPKLLALNL
jgi:hypothetical protein